jgi:hypothetical protein
LNGFCAVILATDVSGLIPSLSPFRVPSLLVLVMMAIVSLLGQTSLFPLLCRLPFVWRVFPNIDGTYAVEILSNWSLIKARENGETLPQGEIDTSLFKRNGLLTIRARLFTIDIHLKMDDDYSTSDTVVCSVKKETGEARPQLSYIYHAKVLKPQGTDSGQHFGAARIDIPNQRRIDSLQGTYWTDRNWHQARNTAGYIRLKRTRRGMRAL